MVLDYSKIGNPMTTPPTPTRVTLSRAKGWKMPPNTVKVARPSIWGNPFKISDEFPPSLRVPVEQRPAHVVACFRLWLDGSHVDWDGPESNAARALMLAHLPELRGKSLACWCKPGQPCHADFLMELAND